MGPWAGTPRLRAARPGAALVLPDPSLQPRSGARRLLCLLAVLLLLQSLVVAFVACFVPALLNLRDCCWELVVCPCFPPSLPAIAGRGGTRCLSPFQASLSNQQEQIIHLLQEANCKQPENRRLFRCQGMGSAGSAPIGSTVQSQAHT